MYPEADIEKTQAPGEDYYIRMKEKEAFERRAHDLRQNGCSEPHSTRSVMTDAQTLAELFKYHAPNESTLPKYSAINQAAKNFAEIVLQNCPPSADRSAAIRLIRDARMTANASVALNGLSL
jgi:hypothetical protein